MTAIREGRPADFPALRAIQRSALAEPWPELLETATRGPPALYVLTDQEPLGYAIVLGDGVDGRDRPVPVAGLDVNEALAVPGLGASSSQRTVRSG